MLTLNVLHPSLNLSLPGPLFFNIVGICQPPLVWSVPEILSAIQNASKSLLVDECNEARLSVGSQEIGALQVYTLDLEASESQFHFSGSLCGISHSTVTPKFLEHRFVEITVDPLLRQSAYVSNGLLSERFSGSSSYICWLRVGQLLCVHILASCNTFSHICDC